MQYLHKVPGFIRATHFILYVMNLCFHGSERNVWSLYVTAWIEQWRPNFWADVRAYARDLRPIQRVNARHVHPLTAVAVWIRDPRHDWSCGRVWVVMLFYNSPCILLTWHILLLSAQLYSSCTRYMSSCSCIARYVISIPRHVIHLFSIKPFQSGTQWHVCGGLTSALALREAQNRHGTKHVPGTAGEYCTLSLKTPQTLPDTASSDWLGDVSAERDVVCKCVERLPTQSVTSRQALTSMA